MGRGVQHPIAAFNDLSGFQEANVGLFGRHAEFENELSEGQCYNSKEEMKATIYKFHILCNKEIENTHSDKQRLRFKCMDHRCDATRIDHAQLTAGMVADCITAHMRNDVDVSINVVKIAIAQTYNGQVPAYNKLWRGRELEIARQFGSWEGSYALIVPLLEAIKRKNSGRYKGKMLIATGYDEKSQLLPLVFSLVDTENFEDCAWFMQWLRRNVVHSRFVCVITDRNKGIKKVFRQDDLGWNGEDEDECVHRLCATHIAENMRKNHCND
ncbi:uncharacterized protein LOC144559355 [Carex rostrata]